MRKQEIRTGVVYAFEDSRSVKPRPVAFLDTELYTSRSYNDTESPRFRKALAGESPHSGRLGSPAAGYLVAIMREQFGRRMDYDAVAARIGTVTLADAEAAGWEHLDDEIVFMLIVRLGVITGPWHWVMAKRREQEQAEQQRRERIAAAAKALDDRAAAVREVLIMHRISARFSGPDRDLIVSLDDAEKLASLLAAKEADPR